MEKTLSLLIGDYVHKLNNLVGAIPARVKIIQYTRSDLLAEDELLANSLAGISDDAMGALELTGEFRLAFTSPEGTELVSIGEFILRALDSIERPESITVAREIEENIPEVHATNGLLDVFKNLIVNASEAMPDGGELHITARVNQDKEQIEIVFTDTGRGMPSYLIDSLFQPYFSTKDQKGHGLGLWWSKTYLVGIDGNLVLLWSEVGRGSSFLVSLPLLG